jgi:hypothetical protein
MDPGTYGGVIARFDGDAVEIREIQPVREHVGDEEAKDVGFPFWTMEGYYDPEDLDLDQEEVQHAMQSCDLKESDLPDKKDDRMLVLAECALRYGWRSEPGPTGWSSDVVPGKVRWAAQKEAVGPEYLEDEDEEFFREMTPITVRETYEIITPESAEEGEAEESGWIDEEGTEHTFAEVEQMLSGAEPSSSSFHEGIWYTVYDYSTDFKTGADESRSYHLDKKTPVEVQEKLFKAVKEG